MKNELMKCVTMFFDLLFKTFCPKHDGNTILFQSILPIQSVILLKLNKYKKKHLLIQLISLAILSVIQLKLYYQAKSISSCTKHTFGNTIK